MTFIVDGTSGLTFPNSTVQASAGNVLQVVQTNLTATFSQSLAAIATISSDVMSVSITPKFSTSKILIVCNFVMSLTETNRMFGFLYKNGSVVTGATGDASGSATRVTTMGLQDTNLFGATPMSFTYLDSPATTSSTTYSLRISHGSGSTQTVYINRSTTDDSSAYRGRSISTITVMEIAA
jgi:hypothetical protein